ncbi:hypothetical protein CBOM_01217 [Ceraceosorus bombacis]|uniref:Uncharacterized protein n=1 Tax=Ceraceosorus bombacis TaxID=401625 RepID=A0A0N7L9B0_9BASI|nr:hypothetical protein CBOM_01217 [Ceraceosorus bombacis]
MGPMAGYLRPRLCGLSEVSTGTGSCAAGKTMPEMGVLSPLNCGRQTGKQASSRVNYFGNSGRKQGAVH